MMMMMMMMMTVTAVNGKIMKNTATLFSDYDMLFVHQPEDRAVYWQ
jgi:hypothetical protein